MMIDNVYVLLVCRVLRGIVSGAVSVISPLFMNEIINSNYKAPLLGLLHFFLIFGSFNVYIVAINSPIILNPSEKSLDTYCASVENKHIPWRELFLIPIVPALVTLFLLFFVLKSDSVNLGKCFMIRLHFDILHSIFMIFMRHFRYAKRIYEK